MQSKLQLLSLIALASVSLAENDVEANDVPTACRTNSECVQVFNLTSTCDASTSNNDGYVTCVCGSSNAQSILNSCASCVDQNETADDRTDNDVTDLMRDCGWTYNAASTGSLTTTGTITTGSATPITTTITSTSGSMTFTSTQTTSAGAVATTTSQPAMAAGPTGVVGGVVLGAAVAALACL